MAKARVPSDYPAFLSAIKERIALARIRAIRSACYEGVLLYWDIGREIVLKQQSAGWGDSVVERLAADLRSAFPATAGFSADNLWRARQLYSEYISADFLEQAAPEISRSRRPILEQPAPEIKAPKKASPRSKSPKFLEQAAPEIDFNKKAHTKSRSPKFLEQSAPEIDFNNRALVELKSPSFPAQSVPEFEIRELVGSIPWGHHLELLKKVKGSAERLFYIRATARLGWTRNVLINQIKSQAYERAVTEKKTHNFPIALPEHFAEQVDEVLKSRYDFGFLGVGQAIKERELEGGLIDALQSFILELGYGFCFVGRQHRLYTGSKEYFIDLLFYHRFLKALVAFELKIGPFEPEHAGKMDFYLNLLNEKERGPDDAPSIGIILCAEKDDIDVEFALKTKANPIGVAAYELKPTLPRELKGSLPTARQLATFVRDNFPAKKK